MAGCGGLPRFLRFLNASVIASREVCVHDACLYNLKDCRAQDVVVGERWLSFSN